MNSLRLLEAGTTVMPVRDETGKFRLRGGVTMPRFNQRPGSGAHLTWWRRLIGMMLFWRPPAGAPTGLGPTAPSVTVARPARTARTRPKLKTGRGRLAWAGRGTPTGEKPVQSEFRFEDVRVVCNDLDDTDFIVRPRPVEPRVVPVERRSGQTAHAARA